MASSDRGDHVRILLARHPETVANRERRYISESDSPYTRRGARQAGALAACISRFGADTVFSSPVRRATDPAEDAADRLGLPLRIDHRLREVGWGDAEGLTYAEVRRASIPMDYLGGPERGEVAGGGETWDSFARRLDSVSGTLLGAGRRVAVVTHGGVVRGLLVRLLDLPAGAAWRFAIPPASVAIVRVQGSYGTLEAFGLTPGACER